MIQAQLTIQRQRLPREIFTAGILVVLALTGLDDDKIRTDAGKVEPALVMGDIDAMQHILTSFPHILCLMPARVWVMIRDPRTAAPETAPAD